MAAPSSAVKGLVNGQHLNELPLSSYAPWKPSLNVSELMLGHGSPRWDCISSSGFGWRWSFLGDQVPLGELLESGFVVLISPLLGLFYFRFL